MAEMAGVVHPEFSDHIANLIEVAAKAAAAIMEGTQPVWSMPPLAEGWSGSPYDLEGIAAAFKREEIGNDYAEAMSGSTEGTVGATMALKMQSDYVALRERAFRVKYLSSARQVAMATARRMGHGNPSGVFGNVVQRYVQDTLRRGGG